MNNFHYNLKFVTINIYNYTHYTVTIYYLDHKIYIFNKHQCSPDMGIDYWTITY